MDGLKKNLFQWLMLGVITLLMGAVACASPTPIPPAPTQPTAAPIPAQATAVQPAPEATAPGSSTSSVKVVRIGHGTYPDVLDPQKSSFVNEVAVLQLAYEGLLGLDHEGKVIPGAADRYEFSPDGEQITFHIRDGLKRSDGTPITAEDFAWALRRAVDPRVPGKQYTSVLYDIKGARALDALAAQDPSTLESAQVEALFQQYGVQVADPNTLVVTLEKPAAYFPYIATLWVTYPTDRRAVEKDPDTWWTRAANHVGNGPFVISELDEGNKIVLKANPSYWRGRPKIDRIEAYYNPDNTVTLEAYKKGELDINANLAPEQLGEIAQDANLSSDFLRYPAASTRAIAFNNTIRPFDDRNVRIAFSQAFDREGYVRDVLKGIGKPYTRWIPPGVPGAAPDKPGVPATDPAAAVRTLVENGYAAADSTPENPKVDCAKLGELKITYPATPLNHPRFQFIANNFTNVFGCPITLDPVDPTVYTALTKNVATNPQISRQGWAQDYPHPQNWLSTYWSCGAFSKNYGYCNLLLDELLRDADSTLNFDEALSKYQKAEDLLIQDVPAAFINYDEYIYLVKPYLRGFKEHTASLDAAFPGQYGPIWEYDVDLSQVPAGYPKQ